ncbi:MAG: STY4851/ECs_5259 family protein [Marinomonas sp.]
MSDVTSALNEKKETLNTNLIKPSLWLKQFFTKRGLVGPSGWPLYQYQMSADEYLSLKHCVIQGDDQAVFGGLCPNWSAAFVLFCSEWFRREYTNQWSWQPIWQSLSFELSPADVRNTVLKGLSEYWQRPVLQYQSEHKNYLGSVFSEGGLPFKLLIDKNNHFQNVFKQVLNRYQHASLLGKSTHELVGECVERLPQAFKEDTSVELIADMADKLLSMVDAFELDKAEDPAKHLDQVNGLWRTQFPLPLDDQIGSDFLNNLLTSATKEVKKQGVKRGELQAKHYLFLEYDEMKSEVTLPSSVLFEFTKEEVNSARIELAVYEGDVCLANAGVFHGHFEQHHTRLKMRLGQFQVTRQQSDKTLYLVAMQAGQKLAKVPVPYSALELGQVPVGFIKKDDILVYAGQASFKVKAPEVWLLLPPACRASNAENHRNSAINLETKANENTSNVSHEGQCFGLDVVRCQGRICFEDESNESYLIETHAPSDTGDQLTLLGTSLKWQSDPSLVFIGLPSYQWAAHVPFDCRQSLTLYLNGQGQESLSLPENYGRQSLTYRNKNNQTLLRKRVGILPHDFEFSLTSGDQPNEGVITLKTKSLCCYQIKGVSGIRQDKSEANTVRIHLKEEGVPPDYFKLIILVNLASDPIVLTLPFPSKGAVAYDKKGQTLNRQISLDALLGSRLHLFAEAGQTNYFELEISLKDNQLTYANTPTFFWRYRVENEPIVVSLHALNEQIQELMSLKPELDSEVLITVRGPTNDLNIWVKRYEAMLDYDKPRNLIYLKDGSGFDSAKIKPILFKLAAPEERCYSLDSRLSENAATGDFELPRQVEDTGPWLVVPQADSKVGFRPKFILGQPQKFQEGQELKHLSQAVMAYHPVYFPNAFKAIITAMAKNVNHSSWQYFINVKKHYDYLPLTTFQAWGELVKQPNALCLAILKFEADAQLIARLEKEFPVLWEFIPLEDWQHAIAQFKTGLLEAKLPEALVAKVVNDLIDKICTQISVYEGEYQACLKSDNAGQNVPIEVMQGVIIDNDDSWYQTLLQQQHEARWPEKYAYELKQWFDKSSQFGLRVNTFHPHQLAVVLLPIFAAAVTVGKVRPEALFIDNGSNKNHIDANQAFHLRAIRDFDVDWFKSMYQFAVFHFLNKDVK